VQKTINQVFADQAEKYGTRLAVAKRIHGQWEKATWQEYYSMARVTGLGLLSLGVGRGDCVGLMSDNRLEWLYTDMGVMGIGACLVPIHATLDLEEISYILNDSGVKVLVVDNQDRLHKALAAADTCPALIKIILIENSPDQPWPEIVMPFTRLKQLGKVRHEGDPTLFFELSQSVRTADVATIVYTSGTTGLPKGALISHKNIMAVIQALADIQPPYALESDVTVPFLPLSHVFERIAGHFYGMYVGITSWYAEGTENLVRDIQEIRPTVILAVPRIC
jgi:long-chain acyl-CoA synthetase